MRFSGGSVIKNSAANEGGTGDVGLIPGLGRISRGGNGNPLQYSCLKNPMDRGGWAGVAGERLHYMGSQRVGYDFSD